MEFYKVENERLVKAPKNGLKVFIGNPTEDHYRFFGYTDQVVEDEIPEINENQYIEEYYEQKDGIIYKHYRIMNIDEEEVGGI